YGGEIEVLDGGYQAFSRQFLQGPPPTGETADIEAYKLREAVRGWLTGSKVRRPPPRPKPVRMERPVKKGGGC
ncbi:MAG: hypothetical protein GXP54_00605, partial [Deltaproteobacteria bacterium]|nr:hypothetical protein [Deltaproteobacteria bacterium]